MKNKKTFNILLLLIVTMIVLYLMLKDNFLTIMHEIININIFWLIGAILLLVSYWFLRSIILHRIILSFDKNYKFKKAFKLQILTQFFNAVTPFSTGGQPFQVYILKQNGINYNNGTNIIVQEFIVYQLSLVTLGVVAIIYNSFFKLFPEVKILESLVALGFLINLFVIIFLFVLAYVKKFDTFILKVSINILSKFHLVKDTQKTLEKWNEQIDNFNEGAKKLTKNKGRFIKLFLLSVVSLMAIYLVPCLLLYGMGDYTSLTGLKTIIASAYVMLIGSFVPIPGGTGGLEYGFLAFFGNFIKGPILSALMLIWRFITYYLGLIIGGILLNVKGKK
ncbi:MAG: lysylphosphatidylglycerol synthase transmembrane domain-containing protein [Bacilli bacterium]